MAVDNDQTFGFSSYASPLQRLSYQNIYKITANTTYIFKLSKFSLKEELSVHKFSINQHKNNFEDWNKAFENSIKKRTETSEPIETSPKTFFANIFLMVVILGFSA